LKKAPSDGGQPIPICPLPTFFGGTWTPQDKIVMTIPSVVSAPVTGMSVVSAGGGTPSIVPILTKDTIYPQARSWLPSADWILFTDFLAGARRVVALKLATGELRPIINNASNPSYSEGQLLYYSGSALWAVPFDEKKLEITGKPITVVSGVLDDNYVPQMAASMTGAVAYVPGPPGQSLRNLYSVSRSGSEQKLDAPPADYVDPSISPDGKRLAVALRDFTNQQIGVYDRQSGTLVRIVAYVKKSFADGAAVIKSKGDKGMSALVVDPFAEDNPANANKEQIRLEDLAYSLVEHSGECYGQLTVYYRVGGSIPPESRPKK
jgi:hypothetical protein